MTIDVFAQHFADVKDPRQSAKISYPLYDLLYLSICAIITGCESWEDIEDFGKARPGYRGWDYLKRDCPFTIR
jgi:hypothetical protein